MYKKDYLSKQLITYIGNKRKLVPHIEREIEIIKEYLNKPQISSFDGFSGSGVVARMLKYHSNILYVNDLEPYSHIINQCYLANPTQEIRENVCKMIDELNSLDFSDEGVICKDYAPINTNDIKTDERAFYTRENAQIIDTIRNNISNYPSEYFPFLIAPLLVRASIHTNTSGVFKGFHKKNGIGCFGGKDEINTESRITKELVLDKPLFSDQEHDCEVVHYNMDINEVVDSLPHFDVVYLDPPYNQHPYGSNYFMLNIILNNQNKDNISKVSGIPNDWQKSNYNYKKSAKESMEKLLNNIKASFIVISYNNEGIISKEELIELFIKLEYDYKLKEIEYQTYRGSRNLRDRNNKVFEYLWILHPLYDTEEPYLITSFIDW